MNLRMPPRLSLLLLIVVLGVLGGGLLAIEMFHELNDRAWQTFGGIVTALGMLGQRLIDKKD